MTASVTPAASRSLDDIPGPVGVQQLGAHDDAPRLVAGQLMHHPPDSTVRRRHRKEPAPPARGRDAELSPWRP